MKMSLHLIFSLLFEVVNIFLIQRYFTLLCEKNQVNDELRLTVWGN